MFPRPLRTLGWTSARTAAPCLAVILALGVQTARASADESRLDASTRQTLAWQIALESWGFSPGIIDGKIGRKTRTAIAAAQACQGLRPTGEPDPQTRKALGVSEKNLLTSRVVTQADTREIDPDPPRTWNERSERDRLAYESLADLIAERAHTTRGLLETLNPTRDLDRLRAGDRVSVPRLRSFAHRRKPAIHWLEIDLERKLVLLVREDERQRRFLEGMLHCSIAENVADAPLGETRIARVVKDPNYTFRPEKWPEVTDVFEVLTIPPGPRNPVGVCWIGLDRKGYGLHGTPQPENIGRTGSHGCFRLTNWDVEWLRQAVRVGLPVHVYSSSAETSWRWSPES